MVEPNGHDPSQPSNIELEQSFLGAAMVANKALAGVPYLAPEHFALPVHARIYSAMLTMVARGELANPVTLKTLFEGDGALEGYVGGAAAYLTQVARSAVNALNAGDYARRITELARRRELIALADDIRRDAADPTQDIGKRAARLAEALHRVAEGGQAAAPNPEHLAALLDIHSWAGLDAPPEDKLLGDLITPSTRKFLVGRTGLGKTLLLHAMAAGMASGQGFLHWRSDRPSRWLIIDGEMPSALIKGRSEDTLRRTEIPPGNLVIYSLDRAEEFARLIPGLGMLEPINTEAGQKFVLRLAEAVGAEGIGFDNTMPLISGDQREEIPWTQTLPLIAELTKRRIAQVYLDHTGHNTDRQYGAAVKAWRMDSVGIMTPLPGARRDREVAFSLSFEPPVKARRRTPDNWDDFATCTIRLAEDRWTSEIGRAHV
jgi:hypothetical protein